MMKSSSHERLLTVCEGAICIALSYTLSFFRFKLWGQGGSIDAVMVPLLIFAHRRGAGWGTAAGLIFGTLKCFFAGGFAWGWQSILLDYSLAYGAVGLGGLMRRLPHGLPLGAVLASILRFGVHFFSGVTIYAILGPEELFSVTYTSPALYSLVYNGSYMLANLLLAVALCLLLERPLSRLNPRTDRKA